MKKRKKSGFRSLLCTAVVCMLGLLCGVSSRAGTLYESPYVKFSPNNYAWTVKESLPYSYYLEYFYLENITPEYWYPKGERIETGIISTLREPGIGEHYYACKRKGEVPVKYWEVSHSPGGCIHDACKDAYWNGVPNVGVEGSGEPCMKGYYSGWFAYCADCGGQLTHALVYMSRAAAASITSIDMNKGYYYRCPSCAHIENTVGAIPHECRAISFNQYRIVYDKNVENPFDVSGLMEPSFHMYNNEDMYEGERITPITKLSKNVYKRKGYAFKGWNTKPDGSGTPYKDCAEIFNLSVYDYEDDPERGTVTLYAQWEDSWSTLKIDPNGGTYEERNGITVLNKMYGDTYHADPAKVEAPLGYNVSFETNGGSYEADRRAVTVFAGWKLSEPLHGKFRDNVYAFLGEDGSEDTITAIYEPGSIVLPAPTREGYSFGGWFEDVELTKPVGFGGDSYTPKADTTLYAKWAELVLYSKENYIDNDRKGAVDLAWRQYDDLPKSYKLYESKDGVNFSLIYGAKETTNKNETECDFAFKGVQEVYTVPYSGFYEISASGAQGGDYGSFIGGLGGKTTAKMYFTAGEKLTVTVGGKNGYNGGAMATKYGNGGGATTIVSDRQGVLMIAGGGGGATERDNGGSGGFGDSLRTDNVMVGEYGEAGGGGGLIGGTAGGFSINGNTDVSYQDFAYNGAIQTFKAPYAGTYTLEVWGARGGHAAGQIHGGYGGYSKGDVYLEKDQVLYVVVGGAGADCNVKGNGIQGDNLTDVLYAGGYNGGGTASAVFYYNGGGGGATHIATVSGELYTLAENKEAVLIVAGGGGGSSYDNSSSYGYGGAGGGETGGNGDVLNDGDDKPSIGTGGTQTEGGDVNVYKDTYTKAGFGYGISKPYLHNSAGGGAGWYGGGPGGGWSGAGGGSGYIGGVSNGEMKSGRQDGHGMAKISWTGSFKKSGGGSSYINEACATYFLSEPGVQSGNGGACIKAVAVGYMNAEHLNGVAAPDLVAPDKISTEEEDLILEADGDRAVKVTFNRPKDNGTPYWYQAESYLSGTEQRLCVSNITTETLTTGTEGCFYIIDFTPERTVTAENADNKGNLLAYPDDADTLTRRVLFPEGVTELYLHVAAVDRAGNVGPTADIKIELDDIAWKVATNQVAVTNSINGKVYDSMYQKDVNTFYVRADGKAPFMLSYQSYLYGEARDDYQIDYQIFDVVADSKHQRYSTKIPYSIPLSSEAILPVSAFVREMSGDSVLKDAMNTAALRKRSAKDNYFYQAFTVPKAYHGQTLVVTPVAGATFGEEIVYSEWSEDVTHAAYLIADGEAPIISGAELLENKQLFQQPEEVVTLHLTAVDALSGVDEFWLEIVNLENHGRRTYLPGEDSSIWVEITGDETLFCGDIRVTAYAVDKVGNERRMVYEVTEFALSVEIERILSPHEPVFKCGESGILTITVWGYADRVEIEFPEEFISKNPELNKCIDYTDSPQYMREERLQFMVPLGIPLDKQYTVTVRAYKGEKQLEEYPTLSTVVVGGSVLDELRTRLR